MKNKRGETKRSRILASVLAILFLLTLLSFVYAATYQPFGLQGSPYSDANQNFVGTDNSPGTSGSSVSISVNDGDSIALEQNLTQENVTIRISASDFDPSSTLSGNYTIIVSTGSEKGNSQNGTEVNGAGGDSLALDIDGDSAQAKASMDRDSYYDFGASINGSVWIKKTDVEGADGNSNFLFNYTYCYYNSVWNCDLETQDTATGVTTSYQRFSIPAKIINESWGGDNDVTNYSLRVRVRGHDDELGVEQGQWSGLSNVTSAAKNKTIQHRYKWVYSEDAGVSWQDGTSFTSWTNTLLRNGTANFSATNHTAETSGNIDYYGLLVEVNGSDALYGDGDLFNATRNVTQSNLNLTQTTFATINTSYFPSTDSANATLWFRGELGYAHGADANDYGGTGHLVNVSLYKPTTSGYSFIETKLPTLNANGSFQINFTLPIAAQGGTWQIRTNYNNSKDVFSETTSTFVVRIIANQTKTYGFYGENTSAAYNLANNTNLQGEIRIETFFYNNPEGFTPTCNVTIQDKSTQQMTWNSTGLYCYNNTQASTSTGEKSIQTNFTINGSSGATEDGFSSQNALLNVTDILIINSTDATFNVYNKGENATHWGYVYNVRGEPLQGKTVTINLINSSGNVQNSNSSVLLDGNGFFNKTITIGSTNSSQNNATGEPYRSRTIFNSNNENSTETTFSVSSLLNVTNIWTDKQEEGTDFPIGTEETSFFIGADVLYVRTHVTNVREENVSNKMVYSNVTKTDGTLEETRNSWNSSTNSYGWNPFYSINVIAPAAQRTVNSLANDTNGNSGSSTETITYSPSYTGNLNLDLWITKESGNTDGHSFEQGDNITIYALFNKDGTATDVANNNSQITMYYGNSSVYISQTSMIYVSAGLYKYNFVIASGAVKTSYFARIYGLLSGADQYGSIWYRVSDLEAVNATIIDITNYPEVETGNNYVAEISVKTGTGTYVNADSTPEVTLIDPLGDVSVGPTTSGVANIATGRYNYTKATASSATGGQWQILSNVSRGGNYYQDREYFKITSGPFDVRDISIIDSSIPTLSASIVLENTGGSIKDMYVEWNLTRTDTGALLDSGSDTVAVAGSSTKTHTISPSTSYIGDVKITFLGWYGTDFTEKAGAFKTFTTTSASAGEDTTGGGVGGGGITGKAVEEIICNSPYIRYEKGCCLDSNNNSICDNDEFPLEQEGDKEKTSPREPEIETPSFLKAHLIWILIILVVLGILTYLGIKKKEAIKELFMEKYKVKEKVTTYNLLNARNIIIAVLAVIVLVSLLFNLSIKEIPSKIIKIFSAIKLPAISLNWWFIFGALLILFLAGIFVVLIHILKELKKNSKIIINKEKTGHLNEYAIPGHIHRKTDTEKVNNSIDNNKFNAFEEQGIIKKGKYTTRNISELMGKRVFTDSGYYIGEVKEVILGENKIDSLKIKLDLSQGFDVNGVIINYNNVREIGHVIVINKEILEKIKLLKV